MARATESALADLHGVVAQYLADKIKAGEDVSASDISNAIKLLKDNNITATPEGSSALSELTDALGEAGGKVTPAEEEELQRALDNVVYMQKAGGHA